MVVEDGDRPLEAGEAPEGGREPGGHGDGGIGIAQPDFDRRVSELGQLLIDALQVSREDPRIQIASLINVLSSTAAATIMLHRMDTLTVLGAVMTEIADITREMVNNPLEAAEELLAQRREEKARETT